MTSISTNELGMVVYICHPSYFGVKHRRIMVQADQVKNVRPYLKTEAKQMEA
jgi:hypothetical protein